MIRPLLRDLEREIGHGELQTSELAADVLRTLQADNNLQNLKLAEPFDSNWCIRGIQIGDSYLRPIQLSAGERDWQRDFAKIATPLIVGVTWSLIRSPNAQAVVLQLCEVVAEKLRLQIGWPIETDELNDINNTIYHACLSADELECDQVLMELQSLVVTGPQ